MSTMQTKAEEYFSTLNPLTKKLWQDRENFKKSYGDNWENLPYEDQDTLFEQHLLNDQNKKKYSENANEGQQVFPKLIINCGEKIVVDFENEDGWTWRDEHSGPFSWMTRSQQDLSLDDLDNLDGKEESVKKNNKTPRGRSNSPDREVTGTPNHKPEKPWESQFVGANKTKNLEAANTADEIFQKFGIAFSFGEKEQEAEEDEETEVKSHEVIESPFEESKLLPGQQEYDNSNFVFDDEAAPPEASLNKSSTYTDSSSFGMHDDRESSVEKTPSFDLSSSQDSSSLSSNVSSGQKKKKKHKSLGKMKKVPSAKRDKPEAEKALISVGSPRELTSGIGDSQDLSDLGYSGQLSPVYLEDPGESSTDLAAADPDTSLSKFNYPSDPQEFLQDAFHSDTVDTPPVSSPSFLTAEAPSTEKLTIDDNPVDWSVELSIKEEEEDTSDLPTATTGFDFLDNW